MKRAALLCLLVGCGDDGGTSTQVDAPDVPLVPTANPTREITSTKLSFDVTAHTAMATIAFAASEAPGATLEVGDLVIDSASVAQKANGKTIDLALPTAASEVTIAYKYQLHDNFDGVSTKNYTLVWPYFCGNMFPCHSHPDDGTTFELSLTGVPSGKTAVFPTTIPSEAPSYQIAWSIDDYVETPVGTTPAGTQISMWHRAADLSKAQQGSADLVAAVDWFEKTLGPYHFGTKIGGVSVQWGAGALGGMEHHPFWHVGSDAFASSEVNVHEAAHGWYGDGIRIACWEDFVLSEGTVNYLAAHALEVVNPALGAGVWDQYTTEYNGTQGTALVWPEGCNQIDILAGLFSNAPYVRGAMFYRAVAMKVTPAKLDEALAAFYTAHAGKTARMTDMLDTIKTVTGYDPATCANMFLRSTTKPPANSACP